MMFLSMEGQCGLFDMLGYFIMSIACVKEFLGLFLISVLSLLFFHEFINVLICYGTLQCIAALVSSAIAISALLKADWVLHASTT